MFLAKSRLKQLVQIVCYTIMFAAILVIILPAKQQSISQSIVTESDWNFYENIDDELINNDNNNDNPIHLASVCGGSNSTREFYILLKSILFYRTTPIHVHLMVDHISHMIFSELFETWHVPDLSLTYYNASEFEQEISWVPTHHYSNQFGLLKLVFPSILLNKSKLSKVIMLDTDMLMLGDIRVLFEEFKKMAKDRSCIGLVENQSDWYLGKQIKSATIQDRLIWPAIGRGFNTGLLLLDLIKMQQENWDQIWRETAELELITRFSTALADQDIFNAVSKSHPHLYYKLPCSFNIQLNEHAKLDQTCPAHEYTNQFRIIHWNSPHKLSTTSPFINDYLLWYLTFVNWDSRLLSRGVNKVTANNEATIKKLDDTSVNNQLEESCKDIKPRPSDKLHTHLFFMEMETNLDNNNNNNDQDVKKLDDTTIDVSIVVHLSVDRLRALDELAAHWPGPISAAIYLSEVGTSLFMDSLRDAENLSKRKNIGYHLVFRDYGFNYPINRLRNVALNHASTEYVFLVDVDFMPSYDLYDNLKSALHDFLVASGRQKSVKERALVVPAFESSQYRFDFPKTKSELVRQINLGSISMFRAQIWPRGHAPTDYVKWKLSTRPYKVDWRPDYEPFILVSKTVARFDDRFVGFGWNKVEHTMQLAATGYEFWVLPNAFIIHQFHPASYDIVRHRESYRYRMCIKQLKRVFTSELMSKHPEFLEKLKRLGGVVATNDSTSNNDKINQ